MKQQFGTLDGLRGVAALSVMAYHRRDWFGGDAFFGHAFLAVDFFFLLSGFVIAHAYGERLKAAGAARPFMVDRVIRLHPMLVFGAIIAFVVAVADANAGRPVAMEHVPLTFAVLAIPLPAFWENAANAFPWNIAIWSLFWELLANLVFALIAPWLTDRLLAAIVAVAVIVMLFVSASHDGFQVGFARDLSQFVPGFPRVCASFFGGVLIHRRYRAGPELSKIFAIGCAAVLVATFVALPNGARGSAIYDPLIAYGLYPILLMTAARSRTPGAQVDSVLGAVSYPLYVIHEPMLKIVGGVLVRFGLSDGHPGTLEAIGRLCLIPVIAFFALKLYDEPVRRALGKRFGSKAKKRVLRTRLTNG